MMRTRLIVPLFLCSLLGCEGRYVLGDLHQQPNGGGSNSGSSNGGDLGDRAGEQGTNGGSAGSAVGGHAGVGGSASGGSNEGGATGSAGSSGNGGNGGGSNEVTHGRWLASQTFVSTSSTQSALSLVDLQHPDAAPVVLETQSGYPESFSPDGRWLLYYTFDNSTDVGVHLVDLKGETPSQAQLLFVNGIALPCRWAPDSSRLACIHDRGQGNTDIRQVVFFDTSGATVGAMTAIGEVPPLSTGAAVGTERELLFLDRDHLVYSYGGQDFARIAWSGNVAGQAQLLGLGGGSIVKQSPDGARVFVKAFDSQPPGSFLADLMLGQVQTVDPALGLDVSDGFQVGYGTKPAPNGSDSPTIGVYFTLDGAQLTEQGESLVDSGQPRYPSSRLVARYAVRTQGQRALVATIRNNGVVEQLVGGEYSNVNELDLDPTGNWLYIGTVQLDAQQQPIAATAKSYLSQLTADGPLPAQLVSEGYAVGNVHFAPNGQRLMLNGFTAGSAPVAFQLLDLRDPEHIASTSLALPLNWSQTDWSADSSRISLIGGAPSLQSRILYVVNALSPDETPRMVVQCGQGSPSALPSCPNVVRFQP